MSTITNFDAYVRRRWAAQMPVNAQRMAHMMPNTVPYPLVAALGLPGEVGEAMEHLKKHYRDGKHPGEELKLELGDVLHYLTVIAQSYGWTLSELAEANIAKLNARDEDRRAMGDTSIRAQ